MPKKVIKKNSAPIQDNIQNNVINNTQDNTQDNVINNIQDNTQDNTQNNIQDNVINKIENNKKDKKSAKDKKSVKDKKLSPIIKWSGGKSDEIKHILKYIPTDIDTYIEPFIGGGALYFYLNHPKNVINDVHNELIAFYKSIKEGNSQQIKEFMNQHPNNEEEYYKVRDNMELNTQLDIAKRFYYLRKTCFRGMLRYNKKGGFNIPFGKYKTISYNELDNKDYENILKNTHIYNDDFTNIFDNYNDDKNFMFLDPPYDSVFTDYGYCKFGKDEHIKLATYFKNTKIRCLMVIGKTDFISELYKEYIVDEFDKKYKFKIHSNRVGDEINTKHLIIKNF
jgi:DNA adenine methylase